MSVCYTIGHEGRDLSDVLRLLKMNGIRVLADIRPLPSEPPLSADLLRASLARIECSYLCLQELGAVPCLPPDLHRMHDHLGSSRAVSEIEEFATIAVRAPSVLLCTPADSTRCHRMFIAAVLMQRGWTVLEILADGKTRPCIQPLSEGMANAWRATGGWRPGG